MVKQKDHKDYLSYRIRLRPGWEIYIKSKYRRAWRHRHAMHEALGSISSATEAEGTVSLQCPGLSPQHHKNRGWGVKMSFMVISHQILVTIFMVKLLGLSSATRKQESLADWASSCSHSTPHQLNSHLMLSPIED